MELKDIADILASVGIAGVCGFATWVLYRAREADRTAFEAKCSSCPVRAQRDRVFELVMKRIEANGSVASGDSHGTHA